MSTKLARIAAKARTEPTFQFTSLYHLMNKELLRGCFGELRGDAAPGIDEITKAEYAADLEANLERLESQLQQMSYRPQPVVRVYIPKPGSTKLRPLGIPALEDKLVQAGLVRILEQIYESAFQDCSYGCRPHRGAHDALRSLSLTVESGNIEWIVEADIKGFFDNVKHDWLMKMLEHRIGDTRMLRLIKRFLKAGVYEGGQIHASEEGTPQGGVISPLLANIYLHYALDLWVTKRFSKTCHGPAHLIRYVDDFVVCFGRQEDAERFREELTVRLGEFGLEVEPTKTKVLAFGSGAQARALHEGKNKPETFDFLGFTHYCGRTCTGRRFRMKRRTARKKYRAKLVAMTEWLRKNRMRYKTREVWAKVCTKLLGHYAYYAVTDNYVALDRYWYEVRRLLHKWLNRRGGKRRLSWEKFERMEGRFPIPRPHIRVNLLRKPVKPEQCYLFNF